MSIGVFKALFIWTFSKFSKFFAVSIFLAVLEILAFLVELEEIGAKEIGARECPSDGVSSGWVSSRRTCSKRMSNRTVYDGRYVGG